jgi:dihydrofolate reductase
MNAIVCVDVNGGIGLDTDLLFHFSKDMKRFKSLTQNSVVIMGRKTFETFPSPLKNRINIVLTKQIDYVKEGVIVTNKENINSILSRPEFKDMSVWIIGGAEIYELFRDEITCWEITYVPEVVESNVNISELIKCIRSTWYRSEITENIDFDKKTDTEKTFYFETYKPC